MAPITLSRREARQIAVRAQLLDLPRPVSVMEVVQHLTFLQLDPTRAVAPSADLQLWSRIGPGFEPDEVADLLATRALVELDGMLRPAEDLRLYRAEMARWPGDGDQQWQVRLRDWVAANDDCRRDILRRLETDGPTAAVDVPDTCVQPWRSSGWTNNQNVVRLLDCMVSRGEVAVAGRRGPHRLFDLAERVYPADVVPYDEAVVERGRLRLRALGIARFRAPKTPNEPDHVGDVGVEVNVEGVRGAWRVDPTYLEGALRPHTALLSPLDRLVFDRRRMTEIFEFDYQLEKFQPQHKRRWGYYALPVLHGDELVGKVDATSEHDRGVLRVNAVHQDVPFSPQVADGVQQEIESLAGWLRLDLDQDAPGAVPQVTT